MATPDRFDEYVAAGSHRLLPAALRLTGDPALAEELVQDALAQARRGWRRIEDDPEPHVHRIMEATYSAGWARRAGRARGRTPEVDRLVGVSRQILQRRGRRRRIAAGTVVVLLAIIGYAAMPAGRAPTHRAAPFPSPSPRPPMPRPVELIEGFPEYDWGARVVAAKIEQLPTRTLTVTFTPSTTSLVYFERCDYTDPLDADAEIDAEVTLNGHSLGYGGCGGTAHLPNTADLGVRIGKPATFTLTVRRIQSFDQQKQRFVKLPLRGTGSIALAIGERVDFADYPLPAPPITPKPLEDPGYNGYDGEPGTFTIRNDPADPARPVSLTLRWPGDLGLSMISQTPGLLHVTVDGTAAAQGEWWNYEQGTWGGAIGKETTGLNRLKKGQQVTLTVRPEHMTGEWLVNLWREPTS